MSCKSPCRFLFEETIIVSTILALGNENEPMTVIQGHNTRRCQIDTLPTGTRRKQENKVLAGIRKTLISKFCIIMHYRVEFEIKMQNLT